MYSKKYRKKLRNFHSSIYMRKDRYNLGNKAYKVNSYQTRIKNELCGLTYFLPITILSKSISENSGRVHFARSTICHIRHLTLFVKELVSVRLLKYFVVHIYLDHVLLGMSRAHACQERGGRLLVLFSK